MIKFKHEFTKRLQDLDGFAHVYLISYFYKVKESKLSVILFNDTIRTPRGDFWTKTPMHPHSIGLSNV